jgi:hypothetical protein
MGQASASGLTGRGGGNDGPPVPVHHRVAPAFLSAGKPGKTKSIRTQDMTEAPQRIETRRKVRRAGSTTTSAA